MKHLMNTILLHLTKFGNHKQKFKIFWMQSELEKVLKTQF